MPRNHEEVLPNIERIKFELTAPSMQNVKWKVLTTSGNELAHKDKMQMKVEELTISTLGDIKTEFNRQ